MEEGKQKVFNGHAQVPVTVMTPIRFEYLYSKQRITVTFYIQRYTADNFAIDMTLPRAYQ